MITAISKIGGLFAIFKLVGFFLFNYHVRKFEDELREQKREDSEANETSESLIEEKVDNLKDIYSFN